MFQKTASLALALVAAAGLFACAKTSNHSDSPAPHGNGANFKNTASADTFKERADSATGIYRDAGNVKSGFQSTKMLGGDKLLGFESEGQDEHCTLVSDSIDELGNKVKVESCTYETASGKQTCEKKTTSDDFGNEKAELSACTVEGDTDPTDDQGKDPVETKTSTSTSSTDSSFNIDLNQFLPTVDTVQDCGAAFQLFDSLFAAAQSTYESTLAELKDPTKLQLPGAELKTAPTSDSSAIAYEFSPKDGMDGLSMKGRIEGGATDSQVRVAKSLEFSVDMDKLMASINAQAGAAGMPPPPAGAEQPSVKFTGKEQMAVTADLTARTAELAVDVSVGVTTDGQTMTSTLKGTVDVAAGTEKSVRQQLALVTSGSEEDSVQSDVTARLVDANTMAIVGKVTGMAKDGGDTNWNYTVSRDSKTGACSVAAK